MFRISGLGCRDIISVLENHMEKKLENEMGIGIRLQQFSIGILGPLPADSYSSIIFCCISVVLTDTNAQERYCCYFKSLR